MAGPRVVILSPDYQAPVTNPFSVTFEVEKFDPVLHQICCLFPGLGSPARSKVEPTAERSENPLRFQVTSPAKLPLGEQILDIQVLLQGQNKIVASRRHRLQVEDAVRLQGT